MPVQADHQLAAILVPELLRDDVGRQVEDVDRVSTEVMPSGEVERGVRQTDARPDTVPVVGPR
jgi:hypothetical protein